MDIEDEDPAWLEACMAAVDSVPAANLDSASSGERKTPAMVSLNAPVGLHHHQRSGSLAGMRPTRHAVGGRNTSSPEILPPPKLTHPARLVGGENHMGGVAAANVSVHPAAVSSTSTATTTGLVGARPVGHLPYASGGGSNDSRREVPRASLNSSSGGFRRTRGIGVNVSLLDDEDLLRYKNVQVDAYQGVSVHVLLLLLRLLHSRIQVG